MTPTGCRGGRSLGMPWQLLLEKLPELCHRGPLLLGRGVWAAAYGHGGANEG